MTRLTLERITPTVATITRRFAAPPERLFEAHVTPSLAQAWLLGPEGWVMPLCQSDARPGGLIHYLWQNPETGEEFSLTGEYLVIDRPYRIIHIERMHLPDPTPDNRIETHFAPDNGGTLMVMTMTLPNADALEAVLATGATEGMEISYQRLETLLSD